MKMILPIFEAIPWLWYSLAVLISFALGAIWYGILFTKAWAKAVRYECECGADIANGEKCTCKSNFSSYYTFIVQIITTAILTLMYFILTPISIWLSVLVVIAISGWMKSTLKFQISNWKRFIILASIDVGYFFIVSCIAIGFSLI